MRRLLGPALTISLIFVSFAHASSDSFDGRYVVSEENLKLLPLKLRPSTIASHKGLHLVKMNEKQVKSLSHLVHETKFTCGGMMAVEEDLKRQSPESLLKALANPPTAPREDVRIQNRGPVELALSKAVKNRYEANLKNLTSFNDRYANSDSGVKATEWLRDQMLKIAKDTGHNNVTAEMIATPRFMQSSVVVKFAGADPSLAAVLVGGHMDTYRTNKPGADDDGSGTITVMEAFQAIMESGLKFKRDTYFAFYAAEEWGLHGSAEVVRVFKARGIQMRGVLQLDMTAFKSQKDEHPIYLITDYTTPAMTELASSILKTYVGVSAVGTSKCGYACSDHASWFRAGYPVAFPFESSFENDNKMIHTGNDTMNILDMDHAMKFVKLTTAFVVELAEPVKREQL